MNVTSTDQNGFDITTQRCRNVNNILKRVGDRWSMLIVMVLASKSFRFNELQRRIPDISQRMLSLTLRGLERDGLVNRQVTPSVPPRVDYSLTELGQSLCGPMTRLGYWVVENSPQILQAQAVFDQQGQDATRP
jgi:DNA-binding HxlR family transcriptional regulator